MPVSTFIHQGKEIVHVDCRGATNQTEMLVLIRALKELLELENHQNSLVLTDLTGAYMGLDLVKELKGMRGFLESKIARNAILGLDSFKMIIANGWNRVSKLQVKAFQGKEEALDYLIVN